VLTQAGQDGLAVVVEQAYGNCPQYITQRTVDPDRISAAGGDGRRGKDLSPEDIGLVSAADTFFLGTAHPERGCDASHRGGPPGFVRVLDDGRLWWPDFPGNNMFNSFGNLAVDPAAALLFLDFGTGRALHLSGRAEVEWDDPAPGKNPGRGVAFTVEQLVATGGGTPRELPGRRVIAGEAGAGGQLSASRLRAPRPRTVSTTPQSTKPAAV
jgi:hypothetical protein